MNRLITIISLFMLSQGVAAQDPAFTQFINSRIITNPAFAGTEPGIRLTASNRSLWRSVPDRFNTAAVTVEGASCLLKNVGFGLVVMNDVEGRGLLRTTDIGLIYSYKITGKKSSFSMGVQANAGFKTIDWSKFTFGDQLDAVLGVVSPSSNHTATAERRFYPDFTAGFLYRFKFNSANKEIFSHLGGTVNHIFQPSDGFLSSSGKLPTRYTVHTGLIIPIVDLGKKTKLNLVPMLRYIVQDMNVSHHQQFDAQVSFYSKLYVTGLGYRFNPRTQYFKNTDAVTIIAGLHGVMNKYSLYRLTYSYDINYKGVSNGNVGSHEINLVISLENTCKSKKSKKQDCFDFSKKGIPKLF